MVRSAMGCVTSGTRRRIAFAAALAMALGPTGALGDTLPVPNGTTDPARVHPGTYTLDSHHGRIAWSIDHMGFSTYVGLVTGVQATLVLDPTDPGKSRLSALIDMSTIGTLYPPMDAQLRGKNYFDVATYPTARFDSTAIRRTGQATADVSGTLSMHGATRPVVLHIRFIQAGENPHKKIYEVGFQGTATLDRYDYGLNTDPLFIGKTFDLDLEGEFQAAGSGHETGPKTGRGEQPVQRTSSGQGGR